MINNPFGFVSDELFADKMNTRNSLLAALLDIQEFKKIREIETETLPYTFNSNSYKLRNYRIYGNTVNGESVGDRTENLFNINTLLPYYIDGGTGKLINTGQSSRTFIIDCEPNTSYVYSNTNVYGETRRASFFSTYPDSTTSALGVIKLDSIEATNDTLIFTTPNNANYAAIYVYGSAAEGINYTIDDFFSQCMVNSGATALPYEPYGYKVPVTVNEQTTNIYLNAPLAKSGNNADYIDFKTQKRYNSDGTESIVTLPEIAVTAGTNTLTVGTEIQPSKVYLQGHISRGGNNAE